MRFIKEVPNQDVKIGLYVWNNKFIIKIEAGMFEQTYKISEFDMSQLEIEEKITDKFIKSVIQQFNEMKVIADSHFFDEDF